MPKAKPTPPSGVAFEIWHAGGAVHSESNPVRIAVLHDLEKGPRTLGRLATATGRSKSTLSSLHMPALARAGLIAEATDPKDARVKWYRLVGQRLGASAVDPAALREAVLGFVQARGLVPLQPVLDVLDLQTLVAQAPVAYSEAVAARLGAVLARALTQKTAKARAKEASAIMERHGLGKVALRGKTVHSLGAPKGLEGFVETMVQAALAAR